MAKYLFKTKRTERLTLLAVALALALVLAAFLSELPVTQKTRTVTIKVGVAYVPPGRIFGLYSMTRFIPSPYYYESSLVNYSVPVADSDYILPYGWSEGVYLPGYSNDKYRFIRTGYISGSGWFETWEAPNGGYIAFLHLMSVTIAADRLRAGKPDALDTKAIEKHCKSIVESRKKQDKLYNQYCLNDDRTGIIANELIHNNQGFGSPSIVKEGGYFVGKSGWPTDSFYGNGEAGPENAHLCVIYDQAGANWLSYVTYQPKPRPVIFHLKLWNSWYTKHKKRAPSPYHNKSLNSIAVVWKYHQKKCNGVTHQWIYSRKSRLTYQQFQDCTIYTWNKKGYKPKVVHRKHIA